MERERYNQGERHIQSLKKYYILFLKYDMGTGAFTSFVFSKFVDVSKYYFAHINHFSFKN